jgi:Lon protease-like protein
MTDGARVVPMFPLGTVLFPHAELPLHVFEPRYRVMVHDLLGGDREMGVVLIERGHEVGGGDERFAVGTIASLVQARPLGDGRWALLAVGLERFRVEEWLPDDPYPRARIRDLAEAGDTEEAEPARRRVAAALRDLGDLVSSLDAQSATFDVSIPDDPVRASYHAAALAPIGALDAQRVLETDDVGARLDLLASLITEQNGVLRARFGLD